MSLVSSSDTSASTATMVLFNPKPQQVPHTWFFLLCLVFSSVMWPCDSTETCPGVTIALTQDTESFNGYYCKTIKGDAIDCDFQCASRPNCKILKSYCDGSVGTCVCEYCEQVAADAYSLESERFYVQNKDIAAGVLKVAFPGGLVKGHPLMLKVTLVGSWTNLLLRSGDGNPRILTRFLFETNLVRSDLNLAGAFRQEDVNTPHFSFTDGQEISIMYIVTSSQYLLYIDEVLYHTIPQLVPASEITSIEISSRTQVAKILSCRR